MIVFDSSALLAYLLGEPGSDFVEGLLDDGDTEKWIHAINLCEVFYNLQRHQGVEVAESAAADLRALGIVERADMDGELWRDVAFLLVTQRNAGQGLALGDAFGLALTRRLGADFITADHPEMEPIQNAGLGNVVFIR